MFVYFKSADLSICSNQLQSIPVNMGNLTNLLSLHLTDNKLQSLPNEICKLTKLATLHFSKNKLMGKLPLGIRELPRLRSFQSDNKIENKKVY